MESAFVTVFVTSPDRDTSETIASALVEAQIVACVNILPGVTSVYRWEGKVQRDPEELLVMKTRLQLFPRVAQRVKELHPYEVPEVIALPIVEGATSYLDWLAESTHPEKG
jgi:periplasmic divalent cation tolerance protein